MPSPALNLRRYVMPSLLGLLACACDGVIADPKTESSLFGGSTTTTNGDAGGVAGGQAPAMQKCKPHVPARLVILSDLQQVNSIRALLGDAASDPSQRPNAETKPFSQKGVVVNTSLIHDRLGLAQFAADSVVKDFESITGCPEIGDDACARKFITGFSERAFRRPVDADEIDDLMSVYAVGKETDFVRGVRLMVEAALGSPSFMYRRELGAPNADGMLALTPHEVASELSFLLTDSAPDEELAMSAHSGALANADEQQKQLHRMLATPEVQDSLIKTLMAAWNMGNLFGTAKDPGLFPEYTSALQASMFHETELFLNDVFWQRKAPISELLTSRSSFVNPALAKLYGVTYPASSGTDFVQVTLPQERTGLLTQASVLSMLARTDNTSVVARGLFVRGALLCLPKIPGPPAALAGDIQKLLMADMTERERAEVRATTQPCSTCHSQFDAFGLLLESYDALGKFRTQIEGEPIDTSAELAQIGSFESRYDDALQFARDAAKAPEVKACIVRHVMAYGTANDALTADDCRVLDAVASLPSDDPTLSQIVSAVVGSPAFALRSPEKAP